MARSTVPASTLNRLLRDCASRTAQCSQCAVGYVVQRTPPDEIGCNWTISRIEGCDSGECLLALQDFIDDMRASFLLLDDDGNDPTLLTTWAMR